MRILKFIFYCISVCVDLYAFIVGIDEISSKISQTPSLLLISSVWAIFIVTLSFVIIYTVHWIVKHRFKVCGTHSIPCSLYSYYRARLKNKTKTALHAMHFIYHSMYEQKQKIRNNRTNYNNIESIKESIIKPFLENARMALQSSLGFDVNISIKLFKICDGKEILETYVYLIKSSDSENQRMIYNNYILLIDTSESYANLGSCCRAAIDYDQKNGNEKYAINSIFNYLMIKKEATDWLSNDLDLDEKYENFYSSSKYRKLYRSLAVFVIKAPKSVLLNSDESNSIKGLLTFDSEKSNLFVEKECREIMGFIAHCLYEIINETYICAETRKNIKSFRRSKH